MNPTKQQIEDAAKRIGIGVESFKKRMRNGMTFAEASKMPRLNKSQCSALGRAKSPWGRHQVCPGSHEYDPDLIRQRKAEARERARRYRASNG